MVPREPARLARIIAAHTGSEGPLLPILNDVQAEFGCVDAAAEAEIAKALNLTRAEVHGVASFYHDYTATADPRPCVQICRAEACQACGVEGLISAAEAAAGSRVRLARVFCLGLCGVGPAARVFDGRGGESLHARLDAAKLTQLVEQA